MMMLPSARLKPAGWQPVKRRGVQTICLDLSLVALALLTYWPGLRFGYIWDDFLLIDLDAAGAWELAFQGLHFRPVWYLSYVLTQQVSESAVFEHGLSLAMFALSVLLAFRVAQVFLEKRGAAWLVTVVWTLLPWQAYPAIWIAQRNDLLIFIFGFSAILALQRQRYVVAWFLLTIAVFSKITLMFVPLYFVWKAHRDRRRRAVVAFLALFLVHLGFALRGYLVHFEPGPHLAPATWMVQQLRFPAHWLEHMLLLGVPVPFFVGFGHAALYLSGVVGLIACTQSVVCQPVELQAVEKDAGASPRWRSEVWVLAGLASLAGAATPALRICGFESLFWLLGLARIRRWRWPLPAAASLIVVLAAFGISLRATQPIFDNRIERLESEGRPSLYPNEYYRLRRAWLRGPAYDPGEP